MIPASVVMTPTLLSLLSKLSVREQHGGMMSTAEAVTALLAAFPVFWNELSTASELLSLAKVLAGDAKFAATVRRNLFSVDRLPLVTLP
jgi:hypothetical protein